jgi:hypothetical protein
MYWRTASGGSSCFRVGVMIRLKDSPTPFSRKIFTIQGTGADTKQLPDDRDRPHFLVRSQTFTLVSVRLPVHDSLAIGLFTVLP